MLWRDVGYLARDYSPVESANVGSGGVELTCILTGRS